MTDDELEILLDNFDNKGSCWVLWRAYQKLSRPVAKTQKE